MRTTTGRGNSGATVGNPVISLEGSGELLGAMHAGVYATDASGRVTFVNAEALRLLGRTGEHLTGELMHDLIHHTDARGRPRTRDECALLSVLQTGTPAECDDDLFWRADGSRLFVSWLSAPIEHDGVVVGAVVVFHDATERHRLHGETQARESELRADRTRLTESNAHLALLMAVGDLLTTLETDEGMARLARFVAGALADWCVLDAVEQQTVRRVSIEPADAATPVPATYDGLLAPLTPASTGSLARALLSGLSQQVSRFPREADDPLDRAQLQLFRDLRATHALVVPLNGRDVTLGAMTWIRTTDRPYDDDEIALATEIARRAGLALDNARLYGQQRRVAETLQRSMLSYLPEPDHLQITARYLPATEGIEVGGDWYDAFLTADGATVLTVGDVLGHDLQAASLMGQVRNLLRGIAFDRPEPPHLLAGRLDTALEQLRLGVLATAVIGRITQDPEERASGVRTFEWTNAGHPPPIHVTAAGAIQVLETEADLMLGVVAGSPRTSHRVTLAPGDTVWLFTDGLVERADQPLEEGYLRLRRSLLAADGAELDDACDGLLSRLVPGRQPDDIVVLAVRAHPEDQPRPTEAGLGHP